MENKTEIKEIYKEVRSISKIIYVDLSINEKVVSIAYVYNDDAIGSFWEYRENPEKELTDLEKDEIDEYLNNMSLDDTTLRDKLIDALNLLSSNKIVDFEQEEELEMKIMNLGDKK